MQGEWLLFVGCCIMCVCLASVLYEFAVYVNMCQKQVCLNFVIFLFAD